MGLEPRPGTYFIICKAGSPPAHFDRTESMFQPHVRVEMMFDRTRNNPTVNVNG
jgi:hypothetical protein